MAEIAIPPGHILRLRDSQFRDIYANSTQTHLGPFDITIVFQKIGEISPGQPGSTDLISVAMSPQHFKAFVRSANETLEAYEATFGKLEIPEADIAAKRNAKEIQTLLESARQQARAAEAKINPSSTEPPPPLKRSRGAAQKKET
jgi:hypothetical protein